MEQRRQLLAVGANVLLIVAPLLVICWRATHDDAPRRIRGQQSCGELEVGMEASIVILAVGLGPLPMPQVEEVEVGAHKLPIPVALDLAATCGRPPVSSQLRGGLEGQFGGCPEASSNIDGHRACGRGLLSSFLEMRVLLLRPWHQTTYFV